MKITVEINAPFAKIICKGRETTVIDLRRVVALRVGPGELLNVFLPGDMLQVDYIQPEDCNRVIEAWLKTNRK